MENQAQIPDLAKLKLMAEAIHGKGTTVEMLSRWAQFEAACKPELILALIAENERRRRFEEAYSVWNEKTEWVQESAKSFELGQHRADVLRSRIDRLSAESEALRKDAERYRWLRARLVGAFKDWDDSGRGVFGVAFKVPGEAWLGCDENIDAAMVEVKER